MARYDFGSLSSQDFEELVRDLLQAEWNVALEAFKVGRDAGIDLRYARAGDGTIIIQCKHYRGSGYAKLLAELSKRERPKIERLRPARYVIASSVGLTPQNKDTIADALRPFVLSTGDILGTDDLEGLLNRHPAIERAHYKLWLTSTNVVERVLHNAQLCHTDFAVDRIRHKLPLFVQSDALPRAVKLLEDNRVVVISGAPGIGKTTLAEMLLYSHVEQGYEPVVIQEDVAEGRTFFSREGKRIFYYDDFLGSTFLRDRLEFLGRNQDAALVDFMEMVRRSTHARFILTTREHILQGALQVSERLAHSPWLDRRCVLELSDYAYAHKARILYNHLYFSTLPQTYKRMVLADDFFLTIIKHKHFNPRLIEWLSSDLRGRKVAPADFPVYITRLLDSPHDIWRHAYNNQISAAARNVLLSLYTLGSWIDVIDLEPAFRELHRHRSAKYRQPIAAGDFRNALQELDGAFLTYSSGHASYLNPSIREFVAAMISESRDTVEDLLHSAVRCKQHASLWQLATECPESELARVINSEQDLLARSLARVLYGPSIRWEKTKDGTRRTPVDMSPEYRIALLVKVGESYRSLAICRLAVEAGGRLVASWDSRVLEFSSVLQLLREIQQHPWFVANGGRDLSRRFLDGVLGQLAFANASDWLDLLAFPEASLDWSSSDQSALDTELARYATDGIWDDRSNCSTVSQMSELLESLTELGKKTGRDFSKDIERLTDDIAEQEESGDSGTNIILVHESAAGARQKITTDDDVRNMFSTLNSEDE